MPTTYRIGELASCFGISTDTLRLYDRMGILPARKEPGNNYRCYDRSDFITLSQIVRLRRCGIPLEQIRVLVRGCTPDLRQSLLRTYHMQLRRKIMELEKLAQTVEDSYLMEESTLSNLGEITLTTSPRFLLYPCEENVSEATRCLSSLSPGARPLFSFLLPTDSVSSLDISALLHAFSPVPEEWNVRNTMLIRDIYGIPDEKLPDGLTVFPAQRCLFTGALCVRGQDYSPLNSIVIAARKRGLRIAGDMLIVVISLRNGPERDRDYYQLWLPVE